MKLYSIGNDLLAQVAEAAKTSAINEPVLYVNIPTWLAFKESTYVLGHEGVTFIPGYVGVQDFIYVNSRIECTANGATFANIQKDWQYYIGHYDPQVGWEGLSEAIRTAKKVYMTDYLPDQLRLLEAGALAGDSKLEETVLALFEDDVALVKGSLERQDNELMVTLWWKCLRETKEPYTVFAHIYDDEGHLVAQRDGYPLLGMFPFWLWRTGDLVRDVRPIALPRTLPQGCYTLAVGLYDPNTGIRVKAFSSEESRYQGDSVSVLTFVRGD